MNVTKQLYQWDTGQKLTECTGIYVDYLIGDEVYRVEIIDGTCIIPDELLQTSGRYKVWECMADNTLREFAFKVLPRPIPPNYVYTPTERLTFEGLVQKVDQKVDDAIADMISSADSELVKTNSELAKTNSELAKTNSYLDALFKLNKGQTYDVLEQESEAYSVDVPSGSKYVGVDMVGGKSIVWNQIMPNIPTETQSGVTITNNGDGSYTLNGTATVTQAFPSVRNFKAKTGHKYLFKGISGTGLGGTVSSSSVTGSNVTPSGTQTSDTIFTCVNSGNDTVENVVVFIRVYEGATYDNLTIIPQLHDLTQMFGAGNEPSTVEEFEAMFPDDYYPYCEPTIISSQTDRVEVASADGTIIQQITTGFPALNSAGSVYDYIDLNDGKLHQRVGAVDIGTLEWVDNNGNFRTMSLRNIANLPKSNNITINALCNKFISKPWKDRTIDKAIYGYYVSIEVKDSSYTDATAFKTAMNGVMLYYELAEEVITDITIPTELTDWLTVEAGGSVTFHNADEGKRLLIPNKLSFVRKLDEVTV